MDCDLQGLFGELADKLPTSTSGNADYVLSSQTLPVPPTHMQTGKLLIQKGVHTYDGSFRADMVLFHAHKETYRQLGLLILAVVFHPEVSRVHVELTHPASEIKHLLVENEHQDLNALYPGYNTRPYAFDYYPENTQRYPPWIASQLDLYDLPCFRLTSLGTDPFTEEEWQSRDTVIGFGSNAGNARLAELLLNAGLPQNPVDQYDLEVQGGSGGVGPLSAEAILLLPGSIGWDPDKWPLDSSGRDE